MYRYMYPFRLEIPFRFTSKCSAWRKTSMKSLATKKPAQGQNEDNNIVLCRFTDVPYLPRTISHKQVNLQVELFRRCHLKASFDLFQKVASEGSVGHMSNEIPENLGDWETEVKETDVAAVLKDNNEGIVGFLWVQPYNPVRSVSPITHGTNIVLDRKLQGGGWFTQCYSFLVLFGISAGYYGLSTRTHLGYYPMIRAALRLGSVGTCIIPHTGHSATTNTNVEDLNGFVDYRSIVKLEQMTEEHVIARAIARPKTPKKYSNSFQEFKVEHSLPHGFTLRTANTSEYKIIYDMLVDAANAGDGFGIDEYPTFALFNSHFLNNSTLLAVVREGDIIGAAVVGPSNLCRGDRPEVASVYIYLLHSFRGKGLGREMSDLICKTLKDLGWKGILTQVLVTGNYPFQFLEKLGYISVGFLPYSAYVKGLGWTNSAVYYKDFTSSYLLPWALDYLRENKHNTIHSKI